MSVRLLKLAEPVDPKRIGNAVDCVIRSMQPEFERNVARIADFLGHYSESPIEVMLGTSLWVGCNLNTPGWLRVVAPDFVGPVKSDLILRPQYEWGRYRSDFILEGFGQRVIIECDGHEFHERTKGQAEHDRAKDREAQRAGYPILRFTGSEIFRDPKNCCIQILDFLYSRAFGPQPNRQGTDA